MTVNRDFEIEYFFRVENLNLNSGTFTYYYRSARTRVSKGTYGYVYYHSGKPSYQYYRYPGMISGMGLDNGRAYNINEICYWRAYITGTSAYYVIGSQEKANGGELYIKLGSATSLSQLTSYPTDVRTTGYLLWV